MTWDGREETSATRGVFKEMQPMHFGRVTPGGREVKLPSAPLLYFLLLLFQSVLGAGNAFWSGAPWRLRGRTLATPLADIPFLNYFSVYTFYALFSLYFLLLTQFLLGAIGVLKQTPAMQ